MGHIVALSLLLLLALTSVGCSRMVTGGNFILRNGEMVNGDLVVSGGDSVFEEGSRVNGSLFVSGGPIRANGVIEEDVTVTGGSINFGSSAVVSGVMRETGGGVRIAEGAGVRRVSSSVADRTAVQPLASIVITLIVLVVRVGLVVSFIWTARSGRLRAPTAVVEQAVSGVSTAPSGRGKEIAGSVVGASS